MARRFLASSSTELVRKATARRKFSETAAPVAMISTIIVIATRYSTREKPERRCLVYVCVSTITRYQCAHAPVSLQFARFPIQYHGDQAHVLAVEFGYRRRLYVDGSFEHCGIGRRR